MKKLYLLLSSTAVSLLVASSLAVTVSGCSQKVNTSAPKKSVIDTLKDFDQKSPLKIGYLGKDALAHVYKKSVAEKVKQALQHQSKAVFTPTVLDKIHFGSSAVLNPGVLVSVEAIYRANLSERERVTHFYILEEANAGHPIYDALKDFSTTNPIKIPYNQANPKAPASNPAITKLIRDQLKSNNPTIFTSEVIAKITFSSTILQPNTAVPVQATYNKKATPIYVKEAKNPNQGVYDALASFDQNSPIEIPYNQANPTAPASDAVITGSIQAQLNAKKPLIFTDKVVQAITFNEATMQPNTAVPVQATYNKKATPIYVKEAKNPNQGVYDALASFDQNSPIEIPYNQANPTAPASDAVITGSIQAQLNAKKPLIFTDKVVQAITFNEATMQPNTAVPVQATYNKKATPIYVKEAKNADQGVYDALASFDQNSPIEIPYNQANPKAPASDSVVAPKIKTAMKSRNPIFTDALAAEITFSSTSLQVNTAVKIEASYKKKETTIYVKENDQSEAQKVINVLKTFNSPDNPVVIDAKYDGKYPDECPLGGDKACNAIRKYIRESSTITALQSPFIEFNHVLLKKKDTPVTVTASYKGKSTEILVKLKKITKIEKQVRKVLQKFNLPSNRLEIRTNIRELKASEDAGSHLIRDALIKQGGLIKRLADQIAFGDDLIGAGSATTPIPVNWSTTATFRQGQVKVIIYGVTNPFRK